MHFHRIALIIVAALALAPAAHAGETWTQQAAPVLSPTLAWEGDAVQEPSVIYDTTKKLYKMWYSGGSFGQCFMGYAVSKDLVHWAKSSLPVLGNGRGGEPGVVCHSNVQKLGGVYYAWYSVEGWSNPDGSLHVATSRDGVRWTARRRPALPATGWASLYANTYVVRDGGRWLMFWEAFNTKGLWEMATATSTDLVHWKQSMRKLTAVGFGDTYGGPCVVREGDHWAMYFHAAAGSMFSLVYKSTSKNLRDWTSSPVPLLEVPVWDVSWKVDQMADASVIDARGKRLMFFDVLNNDYPMHSRIGLAELG